MSFLTLINVPIPYMFQCPSCGRGGFKDEVAVARHMNQPRSGCSTWLQDVIRLDESIDTTMNVDNDNENTYYEDSEHDRSRGWSEDTGDGDGVNFDEGGSTGALIDEEIPLTGDSDFINWFRGASQSYGAGHTFLDLFNSDENSVHRARNLYYPFSGRKDWELASWLLRSGLSMGKIDSFLSLAMGLPLSFSSAKELRGRAEMLPSGPCWMSEVIKTTHPTKSPVVLYWCDPLDCISSILNHLRFHDQLDFTPRKVYTTAQRLCRVYSEWMTGDDAWKMQSALPRGATLLGTILSSDKTNISMMTGDRVAHPLLVSLANVPMSTRLKTSSNSFVLTALLPVPKFLHKKKRMRGVLEDRLVHQCLDIVLEPLKQAAREGIMLSDPAGHSHYCFTPLASYIVDTPEAMMLATVGGKTSPVTMAMFKLFGDPFQHEPRTGSTMLAQLAAVRRKADPSDIESFFREAQKFRLNGVDKPFWQDWLFADLSHFLTPENLHHIHREFFDHDVKWIICVVKDAEIDFRFSALQPVTGFRHFHGGISKLKQVTGRAQRDIQRSIIAVSADAVPSAVMTAVRALMDFRYLIQSPRINDRNVERISAALAEFHANKHAITAAGLRRGKGNKPIDNWYIPKIELMQNVAPSIRNTGVTMQWSADATEHAHITEIKDPARSSNNNNYDSQICRHLDRADKCRRFDLATSLLDLTLQTNLDQHLNVDDDTVDSDVDDDLPADLWSTVKCPGYARPITDYFAIAKVLQHREVGTVPLPLRTFVVGCTAFHLAYSPSIRVISVNDAAIKFGLPDLRPAIADFLRREDTHGYHHIWFKLRLQNTEFHDITNVQPAQTLNCAPPSDIWSFGRYDTVIVNNEDGHSWPADGLCGHVIAQVRLIMRPIRKTGTPEGWKDRFLTYVQRFTSNSERESATQLHLLKRAKRSNGTRIGDVIPVTQLRAPVNVVPRFGASADPRLTQYNSMEHASEFWLNKYWDKNIFIPLSM
ncbi:hypothetical protein DEU56DRAFT_913696 [Suillus clintonianus]|uniref:uncharacterized protein n=1 Tax=Suillus clintonianus TaxID=1904413 RepID=UPI001B87C6BD|nr:uncharacterized protein DEU56DRAFT_913696 [Suillus clintonianus]KAG2134508.1 hypothetical protein DEU56DRAFT_913696 [Suillus clintonianus]